MRGNQFSHEKLWPKIENLKCENWNWIGIGLIRDSNYTGFCSVLGCLSHYDINVGRIVRLFLLAKCLLWARPGLPTMHLDVGHCNCSGQQGGTRHLCIASLMWSLVACLTAARWWHTHTHSQHHHRANFTWTNFDTWKCQGIAGEWEYGVRAGARAAGVWRKPYQNVKSNESKVQQRCQCGLWMGMHQQCGGC